MYTKSELREGARVLLSAMKYLETACREQDIDPRPWVSGDHPLSLAHWILAQCRFKSRSTFRGTPDDPKVYAEKVRRFTRQETDLAGHSTSGC